MTGEDFSLSPGQSFEGKRFLPQDHKELQEVLGLAFDYRGDVTLRLTSHQTISGFVFDRNEHVTKPYLRMFVEQFSDPQIVEYENIVEVIFSGEDTAFGRSWEDWTKKWKKMSCENNKDSHQP